MSKHNKETANFLSAISTDASKTPEQVEIDAINKDIVSGIVSGLKGGGIQHASERTDDTSYATDTSQYDIGYTRQQGTKNDYRAGQQGVVDNIANRFARYTPNLLLGVTELAGHILDSPDNIYGMITGGQSMFGGANDFDNALTKWARESAEDLNKNFVNYEKQHDGVFNFNDPASYVNATFDTAESIAEFMLAGMGTAKAIGAGSKLIGTAAKASMKMDMLGAGIKFAERAGKTANSAITSSSVAAMNATQTFKGIKEHAMTVQKPGGGFYTEEEATEIAAENAANTFKNTLITGTALNYTSLSPFASKIPKRIALKTTSKNVTGQIKQLDDMIGNKKSLANGEAANRWYKKYLGSYGGESLQEGIEEVTENISSDVSMINAKRQMGESPDAMDLFSAENAFAFTLGALGGSMGKGIGAGYTKVTGKKDKGEFERYVTDQRDALVRHQNLSKEIQDLSNRDASEMSPAEYRNNTVAIQLAEIGLVENSIVSGLDNGTVAMMEMDIQSLLDNTENADKIDKGRLEFLQKTIEKHKKMVERTSNDPVEKNIQKGLISTSIKRDLIGGAKAKIAQKYGDVLSEAAKSNEESVITDKVNRQHALDKAEANGDLSTDQKQELELINSEISDMNLTDKKKSSYLNSELSSLADSMLQYELAEQKAEEDYKKLSNTETAEEHFNSLLEEQANLQAEFALAEQAEGNITALEETIANSNSVQDIDAALNRAKAAVGTKAIQSDPNKKDSMNATIEKLEETANLKMDQIRKSNKIKNLVEETDSEIVNVARKVNNGEDLDPNELSIANENKDEITGISEGVAYLDALEQSEREASAEEVNDPNVQNDDVNLGDIPIPEGVADLSAFGIAPKLDTPSSDMSITEKTNTEENKADSEGEPFKETKFQPVESQPTIAESKNSEDPISNDEFVAYQRQIKYYYFTDEKGNKIGNDKSDDLRQIEAAKVELAKLNSIDRKDVWDNKKIALLTEQLSLVERGQRRVYMPKLADGIKGANGVQFEINDDLFYMEGDKKIRVPVTDIFESDGRNLLINTPAVLPGQNIEIAYDPDWKFYNVTGAEPIMIYRTDANGKRLSSRPIAEVPFDNYEPGSEVDLIRKEILGNKMGSIKAVISSKNFGNFITEKNPDGSRASNNMLAAHNSTFEPTISIVSEEGSNETPNRVESRYDDAENNAINEFNKETVNQSANPNNKNGKSNVSGTTSMLMTGSNGKIVKAHIRPNKMSEAVIKTLTAPSSKTDQASKRGNIAKILASGTGKDTGSSASGISNLKKLMVINSKNYDEIPSFMNDHYSNDRMHFVATGQSLYWRTNKNTWKQVDFKNDWTDKKSGATGTSNPLDNMLSGVNFSFKEFIYNPKTSSYDLVRKENGDIFQKVVGATQVRKDLVESLGESLGKTSYNIHKDHVNNPDPFVDAWGNDTGESYNKYMEKLVSTDITTADVKFTQSAIHIRRVNNKVNTDSVTSEVKVDTPAKESAPDVRTQIAEQTQQIKDEGKTVPTESNPVPEDIASKSLTADELAAQMMNDDEYTRLTSLGAGMGRITTVEMSWLRDQIGDDSINLIKGVDRVLTVGGKEAFGWYHNAMITLAEEAETGTAYHEAFHFVFNMALNGKQRARMLSEAKSKYGTESDLETEEALAEDFRSFMLNKDKSKEKGGIRRFFDSILQYIEKILGMNPNRNAKNKTTDIGGLFNDISTGRWKTVYKSQFGQSVQPKDPMYREVGGLDARDEEALINLTSTELIFQATKWSSAHETFEDVISDKKRLDGMIDIVENKLRVMNRDTESEAKAIKDRYAKDGKPFSKEEASTLHRFNITKVALDNWRLSEEQKRDKDINMNPPITFEIKLLRALKRWGFQVSVTTTIVEDTKYEKTGLSEEGGLEIEKTTNDDSSNIKTNEESTEDEDSASEHIYNVDGLLKDPKKSMSQELLRRLSTLGVYDLKNGKPQLVETDSHTPAFGPDMDNKSKYKMKTTLFGSPMLHDMNKAFTTIKNVLSDTPISEIMQVIRSEADKGNPVFVSLMVDMDQEISRDSQSKKRFDGFISGFMSLMNNATYDLVSLKSAKISEEGPEFIFANRNQAHRVVNRRWKHNAQNLGLIDEEYNADQSKWKSLYSELENDIEGLNNIKKAKIGDPLYNIYEAEVFKVIKANLSKIGLDVNDGVLRDAMEENDLEPMELLKGKWKASVQAIVNRGANTQDAPFSKDALLNLFSEPLAKTSDDVAGGALFANGKQFHTINMPSAITDYIVDIKSKNGRMLKEIKQDGFYSPAPGAVSEGGNPSLDNMLLQYWNTKDGINDFAIAQILDFKDGKEGKEYINTNFEDSLLQKVIAGGYSQDYGYFSVGTLSDKLKSIAIRVPISKSLNEAKAKYRDALKRTIYQERTRILKYKESAEFRKRYPTSESGKFMYIPELNSPEFAPLLGKMNSGDMTNSDFNKFFEEKVIPVLDERIEREMSKHYQKLVSNGIINKVVQGDVETYVLSKSAQEHLGENSEAGIEIIEKFLIEDTMWKMESSKIFMGDQAKYKGYWDYFKRMYQIVTPGRKAFVDPSLQNASHKVTMTRVNIKSPYSYMLFEHQDDSPELTISAISDNILTDPKDAAKARKYLAEIIKREGEVKEGENPKPLKEKALLNIVKKIASSNIKNAPRVANAVYTAYSYRSNNRGDAASFASIEFFRDQKKGLGQWNSKYEWIYKNAWEKAITVEEATKDMSKEQQSYYKNLETKLTADTLKPFYYGQRLETIVDGDKTYTNMLQEQYKESIAPILPIWAKNTSGFDWMLKQFKNGVDVVSTDDTVKVGNFNNIEIGADDATVNKYKRSGINTDGLRYPQVPAKMKDTGIAGTQLQKIIMSNLDPENTYLVGGVEMSAIEMTELYNDVFSEKIKNSFEKVKKELSLDSIDDLNDISSLPPNDQFKFLSKLRSIITDSVISQGKSDNLIDALTIIRTDKGGYEFDLGLSFDAYSRQYQNMITSLTSSNILRQQMPGGALVNMADLTIKTDEQLKFLRIDPKTGRTLPAEIAMPHVNAKKLGVGWGINSKLKGKETLPTVDNVGNVIMENLTEDQKKSMEIIVYRIPTQMKSSTLPTIIKRILPVSDGAKIMIPGEMTTQAGLDFDFDKSYILMRTTPVTEVDDSEFSDEKKDSIAKRKRERELDDTIFDVHWSVLTDKAHFEELVAPVSSKTHDQLLDEFPQDDIEGVDTSNVFSSIANIEMEALAKYSHIMRGTFSKFAGGHNVMTSLRLVLEGKGESINDYINTKKPVLIESGNEYNYDEFGRQRDSSGALISENISENLNSALDSQKDPKLGKLNTSVFNSFATGYMLDLGVPEATTKRFMNSPILKNLSKKYFQLGGTPQVMYDAVRDVVSELGIEKQYNEERGIRKSDKYFPVKLKESEFKVNGDSRLDSMILLDFLDYHSAGGTVAKLNDMLSPETQKISDAAGIQAWDIKKMSMFENTSVEIGMSLFGSEGPLKKISSFHEYGMGFQKDLTSLIFPYFSRFYTNISSDVRYAQKGEKSTDWAMLDQLNSTMDMVSLSNEAKLKEIDVLNSISPGFRDRISIYKSADKISIADRFDQIVKKYPKIIEKNAFIGSLTKDENNHKSFTDLLLFPSSVDDGELANVKGSLRSLLYPKSSSEANLELQEFAKDLVAYTVGTSGFSRTSNSFIMMIPTDFWNTSGIAALRRSANKTARNTAIIPGGNDGYIDSVLRHIGPTSSLVKSVYIKPEQYKDGYIIVNNKQGLFSKDKAIDAPLFTKIYNANTKSYQLYKFSVVADSNFAYYKPVSTLGEVNRSHEMFEHGSLSDGIVSGKESSTFNKEDLTEDVSRDVKPGISEPSNISINYAKEESLDYSKLSLSRLQDLVLNINPEFGMNEDFEEDNFVEDENGNMRALTDEEVSAEERQNLISFLENNSKKKSFNISLNAIDTDDSDMNMFSLAGTNEVKRINDQVESALNNFLDNNGITTTIVDNMKERFGTDATGVADAMNQAIYLAKGDAGRLSKPEEVAHIYIESTLGERQTEAMIAAVDGTEEYKLVKERYSEVYNGDDYRLRREAAAKILAKALAESNIPKTKLGRMIKSFMNFIKRKFGNMDPFTIGANAILEGTILKPGRKGNGKMFNLEEDTSLNDPAYDMSEEDMLNAEQGEIDIKDVIIPDEFAITDEEELFIQGKTAADKVINMSNAMTSIIIKLKRKLKRLEKNGYDSKEQVEAEKSLIVELSMLQSSKAMTTYLERVQDRIRGIAMTFITAQKNGILDNKLLMDLDAELKSFENIEHIREFIVANTGNDPELMASLNESVSAISGQIQMTNTMISKAVISTTSKIIQALTSQKISVEQVVEQMNVSPKDVSFISMWIRPGADSADLLVRMTQKTINDAKHRAWQEFLGLYRGPLGLEQANSNYEKWLSDRGELSSDMKERNDPFIELVNDEWYLVNAEQGSDKYNALMELDPTHPKRRYYDTIAHMFISAQDGLNAKRPFGYKLPQVRKSLAEINFEKGSAKDKAKRTFQELIGDALTVRPDDNEEGLMSDEIEVDDGTGRLVTKERYDRDENNNVIKNVPIYYTNNSLKSHEVSLDISTTIAASTKNLLEKTRLDNIKPQLWAMQKIAIERSVGEVEATDSFRGLTAKKVNKLMERITKKGDQSNSAKQINMIMDQHLYGETNEKVTLFNIGGKEVTLNKVSDIIKAISSSKIMILNPNVALSNALTGEAMMLQEAISGRYFNMEDWRKGAVLLKDNYGGMVADIYSRKTTTKMGGLIEFLNLDNNFKAAHQKLGMKGSLAGNAYEGFKTSTRILQDLGQVAIEIQTVGAMANNIKVKDADGKEMTLYDAFEMVDGKMKMQEGLTYNGEALDNGDGTGQIYHLREKIIKVGEGMHGIYNKLDAPAFAAKVIGQQVMFMRGWLFSQIARRFDRTRFQERLGEYDEGTYVSMYATIRNVFASDGPIGTANKLKYIIAKGDDDSMYLNAQEEKMFDDNNDEEGKKNLINARKANVKKTWVEISMIIGMYIFTSLAFDDEDEPDSMAYDFARYHSLRLRREIFFYSPQEMLEIMKNPSINTSVIRDGLGIATSALYFPGWGDELVSGQNKGDNKMWNRVRKNIPVWNQIKSLEDLSRAADAIQQGYR